MPTIKARYVGADVAEDGSEVLLKLSNGTHVKLTHVDLVSMLDDLVCAMSHLQLSRAAEPRRGRAGRFEAQPPLIRAEGLNVLYHDHAGGAYSIEATDSKGRRAVLHLKRQHMEHLAQVFAQTGMSSSDQELH